MSTFYIYILASKAGVVYTGVTNDLTRRIYEHKTGLNPGFSKKYKINKLVYYETFSNIRAAIDREKEIKTFSRRKKAALIDSMNPKWDDIDNRLLMIAD